MVSQVSRSVAQRLGKCWRTACSPTGRPPPVRLFAEKVGLWQIAINEELDEEYQIVDGVGTLVGTKMIISACTLTDFKGEARREAVVR